MHSYIYSAKREMRKGNLYHYVQLAGKAARRILVSGMRIPPILRPARMNGTDRAEPKLRGANLRRLTSPRLSPHFGAPIVDSVTREKEREGVRWREGDAEGKRAREYSRSSERETHRGYSRVA